MNSQNIEMEDNKICENKICNNCNGCGFIPKKIRGPYKKTTLKYKLIQYDKYVNETEKHIIYEQDFYDFYEIAKFLNCEFHDPINRIYKGYYLKEKKKAHKDIERFKFYEIINLKKINSN